MRPADVLHGGCHEDKADMMPHKSRTLPNGKRVVEMVLPHGSKWKKFLDTINEVII